MLAIEVNFLTGRFVATAHNDRDGHEWPPHPARLYSALVDAWAEYGEDAAEREALEWLETQPSPKLTRSEAVPRSVKTHYVPVNDTSIVSLSAYERRSQRIGELQAQYEAELDKAGGELTKKVERLQDKIQKERDVESQVSAAGNTNPKTAEELLPEGRPKQARSYPSVTPEDPRVTYTWDGELSGDLQATLDNLLQRVTRLGHSSSLVACRLVPEPPAANLVPGTGGDVLRCTGPRQLDNLQQRHRSHQGVRPRALPFTATRYRDADDGSEDEEIVRPDTAGDWVVLEFLPRSRRFPVTRSVEVADTLRKAVFSHAQDPIPEGLSGHQTSGTPSALPHVAFLAIPFVGFEHADGRIMGAAVGLPDSLDEASRRAALRAIGSWEKAAGDDPMRLTFGRGGTLDLVRKPGLSDLVTLRPRVWSRSSRLWVSATPVALPTNPGPLSKGTAAARAKAWARAEEAVVASCRHVGLPEPVRVTVSLNPFVNATRPAARFPAFQQRGRDGRDVARRLVHAAVEFDCLVQGPLMLGSGRFTGLGLMRPANEPPKVQPQAEADDA